MRTRVERSELPPVVFDLCARLGEKGHGAWVVGGCVRDHLMQREVADWDLCTTAQPDELMKIFPRAIPTGIEHGTVTVMVGKTGYEITTLRGETTYTDGRRPDAVFFVEDVTHDLARRDFTVNAIAYDPPRDQLIDPFDGLGDLARGLIRAVGDPMARFSEDGLRVLRAARFVATLEFALDQATRDAIAPNLGTFRKVSAERVRDEWMKTMKARRPSHAFEVMRESGILGVVCPALLEGVGCAQGREYAHDVWTHALRTLDAIPPGDPILRLAGLLHGVGKPRTRVVRGEGSEPSFEGHEALGAAIAEEFLKAYRFSNDERARVVQLVRSYALPLDGGGSDADVRRLLRRIGPASLEALVALRRADVLARDREDPVPLAALDELAARARAVLAAGQPLAPRDLAVDGTVLQKELGIPPSKRLGELLTELLERVLEDPALNTRERLLEIARDKSR